MLYFLFAWDDGGIYETIVETFPLMYFDLIQLLKRILERVIYCKKMSSILFCIRHSSFLHWRVLLENHWKACVLQINSYIDMYFTSGAMGIDI